VYRDDVALVEQLVEVDFFGVVLCHRFGIDVGIEAQKIDREPLGACGDLAGDRTHPDESDCFAREFGAQGAAILAGIGVGVYDDLESAVDRTSGIGRSFEPRPEKARQYDRWYDVYKEAYEATFDVWSHRAEAVDDLEAMRASAASEEPSSVTEEADD
jgi:hypothetical protein